MINPVELIKLPILEPENGACYFNWEVPEKITYFEGHFPNNPVLPAFAILDISMEIIRRIARNSSLEIKSIKTGKFYEVIKPKHKIRIQVKNIGSSEWILTWLDRAQTDKKLARVHIETS